MDTLALSMIRPTSEMAYVVLLMLLAFLVFTLGGIYIWFKYGRGASKEEDVPHDASKCVIGGKVETLEQKIDRFMDEVRGVVVKITAETEALKMQGDRLSQQFMDMERRIDNRLDTMNIRIDGLADK